MKIEEQIKMLKNKLYELENTLDSNMDDISKRSDKIIEDANLPKNAVELWERFPPKSVADLQDSYPYTVTTEDKFWIWATFWFPFFCCLTLICIGALVDF
mgnify:CR=1 FL=1|tara:strand:- start:120 stop:419 length:300 start_codon:yes stop_codon:yes gene_type:complete